MAYSYPIVMFSGGGRFIRLADIGIKGNGHMLMLEKDNLEVAAVADKWLRESVDKTARSFPASR